MIIYFAVKRIKKMETYFDTLSDAFKNAPNTIAADKGLRKMLKSLTKYYEGGKWRKDYELDEKKLLEANENPDLHPDLVVRVTGFTAYFANLSPGFRKLVVDRFLTGV